MKKALAAGIAIGSLVVAAGAFTALLIGTAHYTITDENGIVHDENSPIYIMSSEPAPEVFGTDRFRWGVSVDVKGTVGREYSVKLTSGNDTGRSAFIGESDDSAVIDGRGGFVLSGGSTEEYGENNEDILTVGIRAPLLGDSLLFKKTEIPVITLARDDKRCVCTYAEFDVPIIKEFTQADELFMIMSAADIQMSGTIQPDYVGVAFADGKAIASTARYGGYFTVPDSHVDIYYCSPAEYTEKYEADVLASPYPFEVPEQQQL